MIGVQCQLLICRGHVKAYFISFYDLQFHTEIEVKLRFLSCHHLRFDVNVSQMGFEVKTDMGGQA